MKNKEIYFYIILLSIIILSGVYFIFIKNSNTELKYTNSKIVSEKIKNNEIIMIDVRSKEFYYSKHIKGAINLPYNDFIIESEYLKNKLKNIRKRDILILYCDSKSCSISSIVGKELIKRRFKNIYILQDALEGWVKNGFPIEEN